jgi:hypothetical protein
MKMQIADLPIKTQVVGLNTISTAFLRMAEILFIYLKENFLKSNYEMRLKTKIYDRKEKRF